MWVIDPSQNHPEDQGVAEILQDWSGESRLFRPALDGDGPGPGDGYDVDAIVLMGSAASVDDDLPWLGPLRAWLQPILATRRYPPYRDYNFTDSSARDSISGSLFSTAATPV